MSAASPVKFSSRVLFAIILPAVLSVLLFFLTIFFLAVPSMETALMAQKRGLIREMTQLAWNVLEQFHEKAAAGQMTEPEAKAAAVSLLRQMRYGEAAKDYFWINDMHPNLIMHPYRPDLEGTDVSDYADPNGKRLFSEFVRVAESKGAGFVDYEWQWMDDPGRIVPKISFVKAFKPWGWVVGTGIYIEDVARETAAITRKLVITGIGILVLVAGLSAIIILQGIAVEKKKRAAEKEAQLRQEQLYQAGKMATLGTLAAGVAHEINNPNTAISLNIDILKKVWLSLIPVLEERCREEGDTIKVLEMDLKSLNERIPRLLTHIERGSERIKAIVDELKDFSRVSATPAKTAVDINTAVEKSVALIGNILEKHTDSLTVDLAPDLPTFMGNLQKVEQVIVNLLVNAAQSLKDSSGQVGITTGYDPETRRVMATVTDTGAGMSSETLARIRDPFFTTKNTKGNTGLGLAISQRIMEDHGGEMRFVSSQGEGTSATLYFPVEGHEEPK